MIIKKSFFTVFLLTLSSFAFSCKTLADEPIKLPYAKGERFIVVQGYDSPPTHIKKDLYAIDFSQDGCDAYQKTAVAASAGKVLLAEESGYNGGYGTQVLIDSGENVVSRYAHLIPDSIPVANGDEVVQGQPLGLIGNTGLVEGNACPTHPGTHIHFAMYDEQPDGSFLAHKPEPISNYTNITEWQWYLSDNEITIPSKATNLTGIISQSAESVLGQDTSDTSDAGDTPTSPTSLASPTTPIAATKNESSATTTVTTSIVSSITSGTLIIEVSAQTSSTPIIIPTTSPQTASPAGGNAPTGGVTATAPPNSPAEGNSPTQPSLVVTTTSSIQTVSSSLEQTSSTASSETNADAEANSTSTSTATPTSTPASAATSTIPSSPSSVSSSATFNSSTLAIDLSWQPPQNASSNITYQIFEFDPANPTIPMQIGETTSTNFSVQATSTDFGGTAAFTIETTDAGGVTSTIATATTAVPNWFTTIQPIDADNSNASWYSDNWYDLGTGFYGTIRALTLEGSIDNSNYFASHLWLDEYLDANYTELNQTFTISDTAPFTDGLQKITIGNLNIPLQPNKYYRLRTYQDYQNRSVVLAGTAATGTAMWDEFIYGTGKVSHTYSFYPWLSAIMIPNYPPLMPPNPPANLNIAFDSLNANLNLSWPEAIDPDTTSSLLTYELNYSTSTSLDASQWQSFGKSLSGEIPVTFNNSYLIGVRAVDDFGNISQPITETWNFPSDYFPVPSQLDHSAQLPSGAQKVVFLPPTTISRIALWTISDRNGAWCCGQSFISVHVDDNGSMGQQIAESAPVTIGQNWGAQEEMYTFSPSFTFLPGAYWLSLEQGPSGNTDATYVFGSAGDNYPDGEWSTAPHQDAYFRMQE